MNNRIGMRLGVLPFVLLLLASSATGQETPLLIVGADTINEGAFRYAYEKNRSYTLTSGLTVDDFFDSYKAFRLKVAEAKLRGYDTLESVRGEYTKYLRFQLSSRLLDSSSRESQYKAAYARMQREVSASHILIRVEEGGDTVAPYERIMALRKRVFAGADFGELAREYSEDPSARQNDGYLGYFGAFSMVAPFERMAYSTPVDSISPPVRTAFGYHLIQVHGVRASRGKMRVAHIMKVLGADASEEERQTVRRALDSIRAAVVSGADFSSTATLESQDQGSAQQGGILPWITSERFPAEFVEACFSLRQDGEISPIVETAFGLHLIQRLGFQPVPSYEEAKEQIRSYFAREGMILEGEHALRNALQRRVRLQLNRNNITAHCEKTLSGGVMPDSMQHLVLAECTGASITGSDLTIWLQRRGLRVGEQADYFQALQQAVDEMVEKASTRSVVEEFPELGYMLGEFSDGLLLFEVSDKELWNRPMPDSAVLYQVYKRHRKILRFPLCYQVEVYTSATDTVLHRLRDAILSGAVPSTGEGVVNRSVARCAEDDALLSGRDDLSGGWSEGLSPVVGSGGAFRLVRILKELRNEPKSFAEARMELYGLHQRDVESAWVRKLAKRHKVWVNRSRLRSLKKDYTP